MVSMEVGLVGEVEDMGWCPRFAERGIISILFFPPKGIHV